jgi:hypothetical protein
MIVYEPLKTPPRSPPASGPPPPSPHPARTGRRRAHEAPTTPSTPRAPAPTPQPSTSQKKKTQPSKPRRGEEPWWTRPFFLRPVAPPRSKGRQAPTNPTRHHHHGRAARLGRQFPRRHCCPARPPGRPRLLPSLLPFLAGPRPRRPPRRRAPSAPAGPYRAGGSVPLGTDARLRRFEPY